MVTKLDAGKLMKISECITYINVICQISKKSSLLPRPKDEKGGILIPLRQSYIMSKELFDNTHPLFWLVSEFDQWVKYLSSTYRQDLLTWEALSKKWGLTLEDSKKLEQVTLKWSKAIHDYFEKSPLQMLNHEMLPRILQSLSDKLDDSAIDDLKDATNAIESELPTPAVMALNRVAEHKVKKLYEKIIGTPPEEDYTWGKIVFKLEEHLKGEPILHLLHYRRDGRNTSQHPGRRYTQEEAEQTFMAVKELVEEIHLTLNPIQIFDIIPDVCVLCKSRNLFRMEGVTSNGKPQPNRTCRDCGAMMFLKEGLE